MSCDVADGVQYHPPHVHNLVAGLQRFHARTCSCTEETGIDSARHRHQRVVVLKRLG